MCMCTYIYIYRFIYLYICRYINILYIYVYRCICIYVHACMNEWTDKQTSIHFVHPHRGVQNFSGSRLKAREHQDQKARLGLANTKGCDLAAKISGFVCPGDNVEKLYLIFGKIWTNVWLSNFHKCGFLRGRTWRRSNYGEHDDLTTTGDLTEGTWLL